MVRDYKLGRGSSWKWFDSTEAEKMHKYLLNAGCKGSSILQVIMKSHLLNLFPMTLNSVNKSLVLWR